MKNLLSKFIGIALQSAGLTLLFATQSVAQPVAIALENLPANPEMRVITVNLEPGQASAPHRHNAHVFVYVLSGEVEMQVRGGPLRRLSAGDTFYESPSDIHQVSRNASDTQPAAFLVHMLKSEGAPVTVPAD